MLGQDERRADAVQKLVAKRSHVHTGYTEERTAQRVDSRRPIRTFGGACENVANQLTE